MSRFRPVLRAVSVVALLGASALSHAAEITVSAAASLTNAFKDIGQAYEKQYPDAKVRFNFAASGPLLQQIAKGAPVDVFASADQETMYKAQQQGLLQAGTRQDFARNTLVLIVPADSKLPLRTLADLRRADVKRIAVGNPDSVPVGRYSKQALETAGQWTALQPKVINTQSVRQSLDYVARGEVEAGFVYATDAAIMPQKVRALFTVPTTKPVSYPIATIGTSQQQVEAKRFARYVLSPQGQAVLQRYGFSKP